MLVPRRVKYRREFRGKMRGEAKGGKEVAFGQYGLQALDSKWITSRQIEAARIAMTRYMKRGGKVWIKIFPHKPVSAKAIGVRMGSGKELQKIGYHQLNVEKSCLKLGEFLKK